MGKGGRGRFGKKKSGGGGKKGRGKGGQKRKRNTWGSDQEEDEARSEGGQEGDAEDRPAPRGKGKGKGKKKGKTAKTRPAEEDALEPDPLPAKPISSRPNYDKLLSSFGVVDSESEDTDDEEECACAEDVEDEEGVEESDGEIADPKGSGDQKDNAEDDAGSEADEDEDGEADISQSEAGFDCYKHFWDDPPRSLSFGLQQADCRGEAATLSRPRQFTLPGLARCEARRRDVGPLLAELGSVASATGSWARCRLAPGIQKLFEDLLASEKLDIGPSEGAMFLFLHAYLDVAFASHHHLNARVVRALCALHVVDHVLKACREVLDNNSALNRASKKGEDTSTATIADKGFTRARVLILCPFRSVCYEFVRMFLALCPSAKQVANRSRFEGEFGAEEEDGDGGKPADWSDLFSGNTDDNFRLGIAVSRKTVRLYSPFSKSDVLICSPLGLRQITGAEGEKKREFDFLSSIEVCILDRADVLRMQNWDHVREVLQVVNRRPQGLSGIDISRLRPAFADGRARAFRQTITTAAGEFLDAEALFKLGCTGDSRTGVDGVTKTLRRPSQRKSKRKRSAIDEFLVSDDERENEEEVPMGLLPSEEKAESFSCRGMVRLGDLPAGDPLKHTTAMGIGRQFFLHVACNSLAEHTENVFQTFEKRYWKPLGSSLERLLVVAPSYYSFLHLRKFFREEGTSFCTAFEYSKNQDLSFSRQQFVHGKKRVLLVSERFLWYRRYRLKGADYVLFFGPPETPQIFEDILSSVRTPSQCNSMCLFTKYDGFALERIVGHERAQRMLTSVPGKVFVFN